MRVEEYISAFITPASPQLACIDVLEDQWEDVRPSVGLEVGNFLNLLVHLTHAQRVLELGTSMGYSAIWLASALKETGGRLVTVECRRDLYELAQENIRAAGLADWVEVVHGDAEQVVQSLEGPFDLILQDSDKALYPKLLENCIGLVRKHGILVADDALFKPRGIPEKFSAPVHQYNQMVFSDPRLSSAILPIGDGVVVSVKREN